MRYIKKYESRSSRDEHDKYYVSISNDDWLKANTVNINCPILLLLLEKRKKESPKTFKYKFGESTMWRKSFLEIRCIINNSPNRHEDYFLWIEGAEDEFFYVQIQDKVNLTTNDFKCDQEEGLIILLEDYGIL